jgi:hypothetical protein
MSHKLSTLAALVATAAAAVAVTRWLDRPAVAQTPVDDPALAERLTRLERLEENLDRRERSLAQAGARFGTLAVAGSALATAEEGTPAGEAHERKQAEETRQQEKRHFDRLDSLARAGGGTVASVQLRKNIETLRVARGTSKDRARLVDIGAVDCSDTVCRVEVTLLDRGAIGAAARALLPGMSGLSMRPTVDNRAVYYVGAPGHELPPLTP